MSFNDFLFRMQERIYSRYGLFRPNPKKYTATLGIGSFVPVQIEAYFLALNKYVKEDDKILDVGFGLGYGLNILSIKANEINGIDVDIKSLDYCKKIMVGKNPRLNYLNIYDGYNLPFKNDSFDIITCIDVLEHVEDYTKLISEMIRTSKRGVFISTPNKRPEYTNQNGSPKNYWHLREWNYEELNGILRPFGEIDWNFINGPYEGPFTISSTILPDTLALSPFIFKREE